MSTNNNNTPSSIGAAALHTKMREHVKSVKRTQSIKKPTTKQTNPFTYPGNIFPPWEFIKFIIGIFTIVPIKIIIMLLTIPIAWMFCKLSISCGFDDSKPMSKIRQKFLVPVGYLARFWLFLFGYYWVESTGTPCTSKEARVLVCAPHSTFVDTLFIIYTFGCPSAISKAENKDYPLAGVFFRAIQAIAVDRASREAKDAALEQLKQRCSNPEERPLMVFPEGTCTNRSSLITFKRGAFIAGQPVQPIVLEWPYCFFDPTWSAAGPNRLILVFRLLSQVYNRMRVHFLPVYYPNEEEKANPELFARNVRDVMAKKLDIPVTQHSYLDMFLAKEAKKLKVTAKVLPPDLFELEKLFNVTLGDAKLLLKRYSTAFKNVKGGDRIDGETFAKVLGIPFSQPVQELVDTIADEDGKLDFASLLVGVTLMSKALNKVETNDALELVWASVSHGQSKIKRTQMAEELTKITSGGFTTTIVLRIYDKVMSSTSQGNSTPPTSINNNTSDDKEMIDFEKFSQFLTKSPEVLFVILDGLSNNNSTSANSGAGGGNITSKKIGNDINNNNNGQLAPRLSVLENEGEDPAVDGNNNGGN
jgi:lysophosphatidylcholine acyltransferase/lyso-PAF acetyltransferase